MANTSIYDDSAEFTITIGGGTGIQVGQFVNYSVQMTYTNSTDDAVETTGWIRMTVKAVTTTNVTYNITSITTVSGYPYTNSYDKTVNLSAAFGGFDLNTSEVTLTLIGQDSLSTPWGVKSCQKYNYTSIAEEVTDYGTLWILDNILMKYDINMNSSELSNALIVMILTDTNLPSITG
jgi:hypothetical protein